MLCFSLLLRSATAATSNPVCVTLDQAVVPLELRAVRLLRCGQLFAISHRGDDGRPMLTFSSLVRSTLTDVRTHYPSSQPENLADHLLECVHAHPPYRE